MRSRRTVLRERREKVLKEVVGYCLVEANLGARDGGAGWDDRISGGCPWGSWIEEKAG